MHGREKKILSVVLFIAPFLLNVVFNAWAQGNGPKLTLDLTVEKEISVLKEGRWITQTVPFEAGQPGDILCYTIEYTNIGETMAKDASIVNPIPEGTVYVLESALGEGTKITYSIDSGHSYQLPPMTYLIKKPDGTQEEKVASPKMYTHIKWLIEKPVLPGQSGRVSFKVKID